MGGTHREHGASLSQPQIGVGVEAMPLVVSQPIAVARSKLVCVALTLKTQLHESLSPVFSPPSMQVCAPPATGLMMHGPTSARNANAARAELVYNVRGTSTPQERMRCNWRGLETISAELCAELTTATPRSSSAINHASVSCERSRASTISLKVQASFVGMPAGMLRTQTASSALRS